MQKYDIWFLMEVAESTNAPEHDEKYFHEDVTFQAKDGWKCIMFYDGDELDYIDSFIAPNGEIIDFWKWDDSYEKKMMTCWRSVGDMKRLKEIAAQETMESTAHHTTAPCCEGEAPHAGGTGTSA